MFQRPDGGIYQPAIDAIAKLYLALCDALAIPARLDNRSSAGAPLLRMETGAGFQRHRIGGPTSSGSWATGTTRASADAVTRRCDLRGAARRGRRAARFCIGEDLSVARRRQAALHARGESLTVGGLVGPASIAAARRHGFAHWRDVA